MLTNLIFKKLPDSTPEHTRNRSQHLEHLKHKITNCLELANSETLESCKYINYI